MAKLLDLAVEIELEKHCDTCAELLGDLGLPDIQGYQLLPMIRGRNDEIPIIVLSSRGDEAGKVQALDLGADLALWHGRTPRLDARSAAADPATGAIVLAGGRTRFLAFSRYTRLTGSIFRGRPRVPNEAFTTYGPRQRNVALEVLKLR
jgi:CheY-like chemotaxis protein